MPREEYYRLNPEKCKEEYKRRWEKYKDNYNRMRRLKYKFNLEYRLKIKEQKKESRLKCKDKISICNKNRVKKRRQLLISHYSNRTNKCACCGESTFEFLSIDHINGGGFKHRKEIGSGAPFYSWLINNNLPEGFQVLCYNCNQAKGHYGTCPHQRM